MLISWVKNEKRKKHPHGMIIKLPLFVIVRARVPKFKLHLVS